MKKHKEPVEEERYFDPKTSVLPKWFLEKGMICHSWDWYEDSKSVKKRLKDMEKDYNKQREFYQSLSKQLKPGQRRHLNREFGWKLRSSREQIKKLKEDIKWSGIIYFRAPDVEKLFRATLKNDNKRK